MKRSEQRVTDPWPSMPLAYRIAPTSGLTTRRRSLVPRGDRCKALVLCPPPPPRGNGSHRSWSEKLTARRTSGRTRLGTAPATFQTATFGRSRTVACHSLQVVLSNAYLVMDLASTEILHLTPRAWCLRQTTVCGHQGRLNRLSQGHICRVVRRDVSDAAPISAPIVVGGLLVPDQGLRGLRGQWRLGVHQGLQRKAPSG